MDVEIIGRLLSDINCHNVTFIIGAGASMKSGICTGTELAYGWLTHLINMAGIPSDSKFLKLKEEIDNGNLKTLSSFELGNLFGYPELFELVNREFDSKCTWNAILKILCNGVGKSYFRIASYLTKQQPNLLQSSILEAMQGKIASTGYIELARMMQAGSNYSSKNIVITTNFDDLLQQALYKNFDIGHRTPVVISHKSMARQVELIDIGVQPIIFKVHHDFLFEPLNTEYEVMYYSEEVKNALGKLISNRILLVLGYSGAKDNLMEYIINYKNQLTIYWGFYDKSPDSEKFKELCDSLHHVIPFKAGDFDEFMGYLAARLHSIPTDSKINQVDDRPAGQPISSDDLTGDKNKISFKQKPARDELGLTRF